MINFSHYQQTSPFLTLLPLEIRQQIYHTLLSDHTIHICLTHNGESLTIPSCHPAPETLSLPLTCHQIYSETIERIYSSNKFSLTTPTALRKFSRLSTQNMEGIRDLDFTFSHPHIPCFPSLPYIVSSPTTENLQNRLQPQDITWIESWEIFKGMRALKKLRVELDVPALWRNIWRTGEADMLRWIEGAGLDVEELVIGVPWNVGGEGLERELGVERRANFGMKVGEGRKWRVESLERKEGKFDIWQSDWGYLIDF